MPYESVISRKAERHLSSGCFASRWLSYIYSEGGLSVYYRSYHSSHVFRPNKRLTDSASASELGNRRCHFLDALCTHRERWLYWPKVPLLGPKLSVDGSSLQIGHDETEFICFTAAGC